MEFDWAGPGGHLHLHHKQLMLEMIQVCQMQPLCQIMAGSRMLQHKAQSSIRIKCKSQRATLVLEQTSFLTLAVGGMGTLWMYMKWKYTQGFSSCFH